jgi:DNA-binding NarL/FixJ family response regulator
VDKPANSIRVLIADEQPLFRYGLQLLLEEDPDFRVVGQASDIREAMYLTQRAKPDVVLLDLRLPHLSGLETLSHIHSLGLPVHTLVLATSMDRFQVLEALRRGASGILLKDSTAQLLRKCLRSVMDGEYWIGRKNIGHLIHELKKSSVRPAEEIPQEKRPLTPRQLQIVAEIISGKTNKEIALKLGLSQQTVKHHLTVIFSELGVFNRLELALFAVHHDLVFREELRGGTRRTPATSGHGENEKRVEL